MCHPERASMSTTRRPWGSTCPGRPVWISLVRMGPPRAPQGSGEGDEVTAWRARTPQPPETACPGMQCLILWKQCNKIYKMSMQKYASWNVAETDFSGLRVQQTWKISQIFVGLFHINKWTSPSSPCQKVSAQYWIWPSPNKSSCISPYSNLLLVHP